MQDRQYGKLQPVAKAILSPLVRFGWRVHAEGVANIPTSGGAILAPNHISVLDSFFVPLVLPRRITYPAELFLRAVVVWIRSSCIL